MCPGAAGRQIAARFLSENSKFSAAFDEVFKSEGVDVIHLPFRRPVANAFAERWVGSARRECLDHLLIFGRRWRSQPWRPAGCSRPASVSDPLV